MTLKPCANSLVSTTCTDFLHTTKRSYVQLVSYVDLPLLFSSQASNITYVRLALRSSVIPLFLKESAEWTTEHSLPNCSSIYGCFLIPVMKQSITTNATSTVSQSELEALGNHIHPVPRAGNTHQSSDAFTPGFILFLIG